MKEIEVEAFLKPMGTGITRPALVLGDDYNEYILKSEKVDENGELKNYNCMFVNELLAFQIGVYLGVPMPEAVIAIVDKELVEGDPVIRFAYRFEKGKYFATEKLEYVENNLMENYQQLINIGKPYISKPWKKFFKDIENKDDIAKILAFDILIANFDRYGNVGNILVDKSIVRKIYAIDHGHSFFGPIWNKEKINCLGLEKLTNNYIMDYSLAIINVMHKFGQCGAGIIFGALEEYINLEDTKDHSFQDIVFKIKSITEDMIVNWSNNIPDEWYVDKKIQVAYYSNFIMNQKFAVEHIIQVLADNKAFTNYRGGRLEWKIQNEKSHIV